ncbi:MAG: hypothetical protein Q9186_006006 [Xanthomendoza sp. 1 TL-2023]
MSEQERKPMEPIYYWIEEVENVERYRPGGYHPINIDDIFSSGRYQIVHKLGYGSYSTVWLARDHHNDCFVALKVIAAQFSVSNTESRILKVLEHQRSTNPDGPGKQYVPKQLDEFFIDGPNGRHLCLVSEPAGCSISVAKDVSDNWIFPLPIARAIAAKVILGLQFIHSSGVVHGDLHAGNILLSLLPAITHLSTDEMYEKFDGIDKYPIKRRDGEPLDATAPSHAILPLGSAVACEDTTSADIQTISIVDFGEAYTTDEARHYSHTPQHLQPPESLLNRGPLTQAADIWTLACTLVYLFQVHDLFSYYGHKGHDNDAFVAHMVSTLGKPSEEWWKTWERRLEFFNEDGPQSDDKHDDDNQSRFLHRRIDQRTKKELDQLPVGEREALVQMLRGMLTFDPTQRSTIQDIISSDWMSQYGIPAIEASPIHR